MQRVVPLLSLALVLGCPKKDEPAPKAKAKAEAPVDRDKPDEPEVAPPLAADADLAELLALVGDAPAVVGFVRPERWTQIHPHLVEIVRDIDEPWAKELAAASTPERIPVVFARAAGLQKQTVADLRGLDVERPIVVSIGEPALEGPPLAPLRHADPLHPAPGGLRVRFLLPTTDADALLGSITAALHELGAPKPAPAPHADTMVFDVRERDGVVGFTKAPGLIIADYVLGMAATDEQRRLELFVERLDDTPQASAKTAVMQAALDPSHAAGLWVRGWRLRALAVQSGATQAYQALRYVSADNLQTMRWRAWSLVALPEFLVVDRVAELDDAGVFLAATEDALRVRPVVSLTPKGRAIFDAGQANVGPLPITGQTPLASAFVGLGLREAMQASSPHPAFVGDDAKPQAVARVVQEGGPLTTVGLLRAPFALARVMVEGGLPIPMPRIDGLQLVLTGATRSEPQGVVAVLGEAAIGGYASLGSGSLPQKPVIRSGEPTVVALGFGGGDPKAVLDLDKPQPALDAFVSGRASIGALAKAMGASLRIPDSRFAVRRSGAALVGEWVFGTGEPDWAPSFDETWSSPIMVGHAAKDCELALARGFNKMGEAMAMADRSMTATFLARGREEMREHFKCAADNPSAEWLEQHLLDAAVVVHVERGQLDAAKALLKGACSGTSKADACKHKPAIDAMPTIAVPTYPTDATCRASPTMTLTVGRDKAWVGLDPVALDPDKVFAALEARLPDPDPIEAPDSLGGILGTIALGVRIEPDTEFSVVRPILAGLAKRGVKRIVVPNGKDGFALRLGKDKLSKAEREPPEREPESESRPLGLLPPTPGLLETPSVFEPDGVLTLSGEVVEYRYDDKSVEFAVGDLSRERLEEGVAGFGAIDIVPGDDAPWSAVSRAGASACPAGTLVLESSASTPP